MATNKFATMLHRNTHRITVVLVYTLLEWILIILLLLNSLFSYIISKFASFFGLQTPCLWCSRLDHLIEPQKPENYYRTLICDAHAVEISKLGYCLNHNKLSEACDMCEDCSSSQPSQSRTDRKIALFSVISSDGASKTEMGAKNLKCSCCGLGLDEGFYSKYLLFKPSWDVLDYKDKGDLINRKGEEEDNFDDINDVEYPDPLKLECPKDLGEDSIQSRDHQIVSNVPADVFFEKAVENEAEEEKDAIIKREQEPLDNLNLHLEGTTIKSCDDNEVLNQVYYGEDLIFEISTPPFDGSSNYGRLVPIELIDSMTMKNQSVSTSSKKGGQVAPLIDLETDFKGIEETRLTKIEWEEDNEPTFSFFVKESITELVEEIGDEIVVAQAMHALSRNREENDAIEKEFPELSASEEESKMIDCENLMKSDVRHEDETSSVAFHLPSSSVVSLSNNQSSCHELEANNLQGANVAKELVDDGGDCSLMSRPIPEDETVDWIEGEEEKIPETPNYLESILSLHKKLLFERKESGTESLDESVISEIEGGEITVDRLKSALRAERKSLNALYSELEEERSASAIAANQTMAMITRLQEEKAAMQMEALQYQRMMEEQSEYDQEALQLLNELIVKREKENQELEKELELYQKKVLHYEAREKRIMREKAYRVTPTSSASSGADDSDELSVDGEENLCAFQESAQNNPTDDVHGSGVIQENVSHLATLDESLADFEGERLSILEQLKALEERLFTLDDDQEHFEDVKAIELLGENGNFGYRTSEFHTPCEDGTENGFHDEMDISFKQHYERANMVSKPKRLLPLFDAISVENGELHEEQEHSAISQFSVSNLASKEKKLAIEEEVDHVYERLQALEADREFLKHCINSLKKGDKGMDLLKEILQHLRDLRTVELRVRNTSDSPL